jgi:molecular chaperone IbpA
MRTCDFSPLWRSTIGFDRLFDLAETAQRAGEDNYAPLQYRTVGRRPLSDFSRGGRLLAGRNHGHGRAKRGHHRGQQGRQDGARISLSGISARPFKRQFNLADYVQAKSAAFENGLLRIELIREIPEAMKPRRIAINGSPANKVQQLEAKAA